MNAAAHIGSLFGVIPAGFLLFFSSAYDALFTALDNTQWETLRCYNKLEEKQ